MSLLKSVRAAPEKNVHSCWRIWRGRKVQVKPCGDEAQLARMMPNSTAKPSSHVAGPVLEQNGEGKFENYWLLYEVVRGKHERRMQVGSSNIW